MTHHELRQVSSPVVAPPAPRTRFATLKGAKMACARRFYPPGSVIVELPDWFEIHHRDGEQPLRPRWAWRLSDDWKWEPLAPHPPANGLK